MRSFFGLLLSSFLPLIYKMNRGRIPVLMYHGVTGETGHHGIENHQGKHVHADDFLRQMMFIKKYLSPISLTSLVKAMSGDFSLPPKSVIITFDDGYRNNYEYAFPILKSLSIPATIFLATDFINRQVPLWPDRIEYSVNNAKNPELELNLSQEALRSQIDTLSAKKTADTALRRKLKHLPDPVRLKRVREVEKALGISLSPTANGWETYAPMTWDQIREMKRSGVVDFGAHTVSHAILTRCTPGQMKREAFDSRATIEEHLAEPCSMFAYPNGRPGDFDAKTKRVLKEVGYCCALTTVRDFARVDSDIYALPRLAVKAQMQPPAFVSQLSSCYILFEKLKEKLFWKIVEIKRAIVKRS